MSFTKNADAGQAGQGSERAGFALPVQQVVVGCKKFIEDFFDIGSAAGSGHILLRGRIDLHVDARGGKTFKKLRQRFVFGGQPEPVLVDPEFEYVCLHANRAESTHQEEALKDVMHRVQASRKLCEWQSAASGV